MTFQTVVLPGSADLVALSGQVAIEVAGMSRGNPGVAGCAAVVLSDPEGQILAWAWEQLPHETTNAAEWHGLLTGLQLARDLGAGVIEVRTRHKAVIEQSTSRWAVKRDSLTQLHEQAVSQLTAFSAVSWTWLAPEVAQLAAGLAADALAGTADSWQPALPRAAAKPNASRAKRALAATAVQL